MSASAATHSTPSEPPPLPPLPNPSTGSANPAASLPALWGYLQPALDHIVRSPTNNTSKAPAIEVSYHMGVHTAVYNYFTSQSEQASPGPAVAGLRPMPSDKGRPSGTDLYEQLDRYYADTARELFLGAPADDSTLIHYLVPCFHRYSAGAQSVSRLLNYVNRHYVKRAVDEDRGWLRLADVLDAVARTIQEDDTREKIQRRLRERRAEELRKWGLVDGARPAEVAQAEAYAEAASPPDRVVPLTSVAYRRFRMEVLEPLLAVPKMNGKGKGKKKKPPAAAGADRPAMPKGRLARAVKELLESEGGDEEERKRLAGGLAVALRTCGIKVDHPLRKKLDKFIPPPPAVS
ncbi:uncharacterized protein LAESUDRAFT_736955 [Laetiporus sulphureus 93-53]|uniref:Uncharacterized protein n=1 Tax=Laetiporus sulphureus 93-53 TaxID=1314785 RepID=A0A165E3U5_9APHY|nr:uncharacterized protein LAESUDRAFT_736955 [Laetiporus sulphureus 93-53]KZT06197.1 hypothetical protein LAESUDRAFT_736955 [Laetiporus sulphureus 93-53]